MKIGTLVVIEQFVLEAGMLEFVRNWFLIGEIFTGWQQPDKNAFASIFTRIFRKV